MTTGVSMTEEEILSLSDEQIMSMSQAPELTQGESPVVPAEEVETTQTTEDDIPEETQETETGEDTQSSDTEVPATEQVDNTPNKEVSTEQKPEIKKEADKTDKPKSDAAEVNYEEAYKKVMAPFKANGKEINLASPEEAIKLMQMGANYTKKMQALQPNLKLLKMLENQGLLDEGKLSYLIDLDKKNPAAIQQLIKDSGIDPLEIDTTKDTGYVPSNHSVSDQELQFKEALDNLYSIQGGNEMIVAIDKQWDDASKQAIYKEPAVLGYLAQQKENGIYDRVMAEVEKQKMLGNLNGIPILQAYQTVGQNMQAQGAFNQPAEKVVETRAKVVNQAKVANNDKARAASPTKTAPSKTTVQDFNPLAMSDEDFLKHMQTKL